MVLIKAMRDYFNRANFVRNDRRKKYSEFVKCKSVTSSRFATHKWTQIHQTRRIAGKEFSPTPVYRYNLVPK